MRSIALINEGLGGNYASIDSEGFVSLSVTSRQYDGFTNEQKGFYDVINGVIQKEGTVEVSVGTGVDGIFSGSFHDSVIDDMEAQGNRRINKFVIFIHEIREQQAKQLEGKSFDSAHMAALEDETEVAGRFKRVVSQDRSEFDGNGNISGKIIMYYHEINGRTVIRKTFFLDKCNVCGSNEEKL